METIIPSSKLAIIPETPYMETPKKTAIEVFNEISLDWKVQIFDCLAQDLGHPPSSYITFSDADTLLPKGAPEEFAMQLVTEVGTMQDAYTIAKASIEEHMKLVSSYAINRQMNNPGFNKIMENAMLNEKDEHAIDEAKATLCELIDKAENAKSKSPSLVPRKHKVKKKGAKRQTHLDNIKGHGIKSAMGANILRKLGAIQQKTLDHTKHQLLQEIPMADLVEASTGEKLPDYQANLLNSWHAKADPNAPIVSKIQSSTVPYIRRHVDIVNKMLGKTQTKPYAEALDEALDTYLNETLLPEGVDTVNLTQVKDAIRKHLLENRKAEILTDLQSETAKVLDLTEQFEDSIPMIRLEVSDEYGESFFIRRKDDTELRFSAESIYEDAADELGTTIAFVDDRANGPEYLKGLNRAVAEHLVEIDLSSLEGDEDAIYHVYRRFLVGYTAGFVKGMADAAVKVAKLNAVESTAADLG